jgi:hypothetical protein
VTLLEIIAAMLLLAGSAIVCYVLWWTERLGADSTQPAPGAHSEEPTLRRAA